MEDIKKHPLTLCQPNKVTNARYDYNEREENILTLMIDAIQKHMTREKPIQTDLFNQPMIRIDTKDVGSNHKADYIKALQSLRKKDISFEWTNEEGKRIETETSLVGAIHNHKESSIIDVTIQSWAIPYLTYIGKGVGGTIYNKTIALTLRGQYTKRMYKLCKEWENKGGFSMSIDEFRKKLCLEDKYPKTIELKRRVLDPSQERMKEGADVYFNCSFDKKGGSRSYNQINFTIFGNNKALPKEKKTDLYVFVYNMLCISYPNHQSSAAQEICDRIAQVPEKFESLYHKMKKLKGQLERNEKDISQIIGLIRHIIKEDFS